MSKKNRNKKRHPDKSGLRILHTNTLLNGGGTGVDVVILDVMLPDGNGLDLVDMLHKKYSGVPVIVNVPDVSRRPLTQITTRYRPGFHEPALVNPTAPSAFAVRQLRSILLVPPVVFRRVPSGR